MDCDELPEASHMTLTSKSPQTSNHLGIWFEFNWPSQPDDVDLLSAQLHFRSEFRLAEHSALPRSALTLSSRSLITYAGTGGYLLLLVKLTGSVGLDDR